MVVMTRKWLRWLPAVVVPAVIAAGALVGSAQADAAVSLPPKTPAQVLAMISQSTVRALSGTLEQTSQLGLPQIPTRRSSTTSGAAAALDLLTGSHTARVYLDGPTNVRVQVMDSLAERDLVRRGNDVWLYTSADNTATHLTLPSGNAAEEATPSGVMQTPAQMASKLLSAVDPSTQVTVGSDTKVAGRTAYELLLSPRSSGTLVGSVSIAVDSETGLVLSVVIRARGQDKPAFAVAFTDLALQAPAADRFQFTPPPGATVTQHVLPQPATKDKPAGAAEPRTVPSALQPTVTGSGWDAVVELPAGIAPPDLTSSPLFGQVTRAVPGGRLLHTALVNVLLTSDGRVLAGSVPPERLQAVADGQ
jgi:outer membrane lipoprotein-sorting protein